MCQSTTKGVNQKRKVLGCLHKAIVATLNRLTLLSSSFLAEIPKGQGARLQGLVTLFMSCLLNKGRLLRNLRVRQTLGGRYSSQSSSLSGLSIFGADELKMLIGAVPDMVASIRRGGADLYAPTPHAFPMSADVSIHQLCRNRANDKIFDRNRRFSRRG